MREPSGTDDAGGGAPPGQEEPPAKRARLGEEKPLAEVEKELHTVQSDLQHLEEKCCEEQIAIQQKYDKMRRPFFEKRSAMLRKVPAFWRAALGGHPAKLCHPAEMQALEAFQDVDVQENLDANGSYLVKITLAENGLLAAGELTKKVTFHDVPLGESVEPAVLTPASDEGRALLALVGGAAQSILGWLVSKERSTQSEDFGDLLRREIWQDPIPFFLAYQNVAAAGPTRNQAEGQSSLLRD